MRICHNVVYLKDEEFTHARLKFYGSPYSPSFFRKHWAFNADRVIELTNL